VIPIGISRFDAVVEEFEDIKDAKSGCPKATLAFSPLENGDVKPSTRLLKPLSVTQIFPERSVTEPYRGKTLIKPVVSFFSLKGNLKAISTTALVIIIVVILVVAGVGAYYASTLAKSTSTGKTVTVNFYESLAASESTYFQTFLIPEFESVHPNITVDFINLPTGQPPQELATLVASGDVGTSIFGLDNLAVGSPLYAGQLMNLSSLVSTMMPSTLISSATQMVNYENQVFHGVYFIPFRSNIPLVWYSKTAFSKAGITSPPATDAKLLADAQKLGPGSVMFQGSANTGTEGGADTGTELYQFMVQDGGNPFLFNDTGDIQAMQFVDNLSTYFNPGYTAGYFGTYTGLASGSYSLLDYQWPFIYSSLTNQTFAMTNQTLGVYPGPSGTSNGNHLLGGDVLAIPVGAKNLPAIETLANFLLSPTAQKQTLVALSWVAVNSQAYTNLPANTTVVGGALQQSISTGVFLRNPTPWMSEWNVYASDAFTKIIVQGGGYSSIQSTMNYYNQHMYNYLVTNYNATVANQYEAGGFAPISV
jgi:trehalose transport system substrate-binding protein